MESAGSSSVFSLMVMPAGKGLFQRVIGQSCTFDLPPHVRALPHDDRALPRTHKDHHDLGTILSSHYSRLLTAEFPRELAKLRRRNQDVEERRLAKLAVETLATVFPVAQHRGVEQMLAR